MRKAISPSHPAGFTLIELMITVVVVGILGAIAYPSFMQAVYKSRRADGTAAVMRVQQALERWRSSNTAYTINASATGLNVPLVSGDGHYTVAITLPTATTYRVTATAQGSQANDSKCRILFVTMATGTPTYGSSDGTTELTASSPCWSR